MKARLVVLGTKGWENEGADGGTSNAWQLRALVFVQQTGRIQEILRKHGV